MARRMSRGLTLMELGVVLAVMMVMATMALPPYMSLLQRQRLISAAEALAADVADARHEAAHRGSVVHLQLQAGEQWCWAVAREAGCACGEAKSCQLKRVRQADHPGVTFVQTADVQLDPEGRALQPVRTELVAGGERLRVEVSTMGRAHLCAPDAPLKRIPRCAA